MKIKEVIHHLEKRFPLYWQEDFDNCGIQCGDKEQEITAALVCFDFSEEVINEALALNANLIVSHHPLMLRNGIKKIEPTNRVGKIICKALENKLVLYSMHTNIDSGIGGGNTLFANKLGLKNVKVLAPKEALFQKLVVYVPTGNSVALKDALFAAGCGTFGNYKNCSFSVEGTGTFEPLKGAKPYIGQINNTEVVEEERVEMIFPTLLQRKVIDTLYKFHPYEEPAFDIFKLENSCREIGLGRIGKLEHPLGNDDFFTFLKEKLSLKIIKYSGKINRKIETVALCGGGGSSFISHALSAGADAYVSGDMKYHDFFIPDNQMIIADIGHFEGEHFIKEIIYNELKENFTTFASSISKTEKLEINIV